MVNQTPEGTIHEIRQAIQEKERDLSELDLMLDDYHIEHSRLLRELRQLQAQLFRAEIAEPLAQEPKHNSTSPQPEDKPEEAENHADLADKASTS